MKNSTIREVEKLEAAMAIDPPVIVWTTNNHGVKVGIVLRDSHADHPNHKPKRKTA